MRSVLLLLFITVFSTASVFGKLKNDKEYFSTEVDEMVDEEIYQDNLTEKGVEDVYVSQYGGDVLNFFFRGDIGIVDDLDPDIGIVEDPDTPPSLINEYIPFLLLTGIGLFIYYKRCNKKQNA